MEQNVDTDITTINNTLTGLSSNYSTSNVLISNDTDLLTLKTTLNETQDQSVILF